MNTKRTMAPSHSIAETPAGLPATSATSRRNFLKLSIGAFAALPAVAAGTFALPWARKEALADQESEPVHIVVVTAKEIGFAITDKADDGNVPVAGAEVVLTSRYNGKVLRDTSNEEGVVKFDITDLAEPRNDDDGTYAFNGTIDVTCPGYRTFHLALARLTGGTAMVVPTRTIEPDRPYPVCVSFDEWDALYTKNTFVTTTGNINDHTLHVQVEEMPATGTIALKRRGQDAPLATASLTPSGGRAEADMVAPFLQQSYEHALQVGDYLYMEIVCAGYVYEFPIAIGVMLGCVAAPQSQEDVWLAPVNNTTTPDLYTIKLPDFIPVFGGQNFTPWTPNWNVSLIVDPFGYFYLAWKTPRVGYVSDNGSTDPNKWGIHTYASASDQFIKAVDAAVDNVTDAYAKISQGAKATQLSFTKAITCAASLRMEAVGKWDWEKGSFSGYAGAQAMLECGISATEQFAVGPVPFYISFGVSLNFIAALGVGFQAREALDFSTYEFDYTNSGFTGAINFSPYLSLGAGLYGIASVGVRGALTLTAFTGMTVTPGPQYHLPHSVVGANGSISVEVQLFLFKWSGTITDFDKPRLLDSWEDDAKVDASALTGPGAYALKDGMSYTVPEGLLASSGKTRWQVLVEDMEPVTTADLAGTAEVRLTSVTNDVPVFDEAMTVTLLDEAGQDVGAELTLGDTIAAGGSGSPWSQEPLKEPAMPEIAFGVHHVDQKNGGIWPQVDREIMADIFSDPRMKVVTVKDPQNPSLANEYLFRIASVEVNGQMRTRVVYHFSYNGSVGPANVVEFYSSSAFVSRDDDFDYDFDVTTNPEGSDIYLVLVYGPRPDGDMSSITAAWDDLQMAYVHFTVEAGSIADYRARTWYGTGTHTTKASRHTLFCPRIAHVEGAGEESVVAISWIHRFVREEGASIGADTAETALSAVIGAHGAIYEQYFEEHAQLADNTIFDLAINRGAKNADGTWTMYFVPRGEGGSSAYMARLDSRKEPPYIYPTYQDITCCGTHDLAGRLVPWPAHDGFLASHGGRLVHVTLDASGLVLEDAGVEGFEVNSFGMDPTGTFIYYTQNRSGVAGREYDEDGNSEVIQVDENRLMALKTYNGSFTDPYVLCNVAHPMENIACLRPLVGAMAFISAAITDFSTSKASLWYTAVPCVACFTLLGAAAVPPIVAAGDKAHVLLTLRNDGNVHLTGAKMTITDESGTVLAGEWLPFSTETLQASLWNPPAQLTEGSGVLCEPALEQAALHPGAAPTVSPAVLRTGAAPTTAPAVFHPGEQPKSRSAKAALLNASPNGELVPGKTGVYMATFTVPEDWSDDHFVTITLGEPDWVGAASLPGDENPVKLGATLSAGNLGLASVKPEANVDYETTQDAPVTVRKADEEPGGDEPGGDTPGGDTPGGDTPGGDTPGGGGGDTPTPKPDPHIPVVGDGAGPVLGATAALAAIGVGFAVYSARRTAIEAQAAEEDMTER